jgi:hypothetical protein
MHRDEPLNHGTRGKMGKRWRELKDAAVAGVRVPDVNGEVDEGELAWFEFSH